MWHVMHVMSCRSFSNSSLVHTNATWWRGRKRPCWHDVQHVPTPYSMSSSLRHLKYFHLSDHLVFCFILDTTSIRVEVGARRLKFEDLHVERWLEEISLADCTVYSWTRRLRRASRFLSMNILRGSGAYLSLESRASRPCHEAVLILNVKTSFARRQNPLP